MNNERAVEAVIITGSSVKTVTDNHFSYPNPNRNSFGCGSDMDTVIRKTILSVKVTNLHSNYSFHL